MYVKSVVKDIYIPLWSYSNKILIFIKKYIISFTFHYGPIQMNKNKYVNKKKSSFTFHYGPIQMQCRDKQCALL